jgi:hypothetical protein
MTYLLWVWAPHFSKIYRPPASHDGGNKFTIQDLDLKPPGLGSRKNLIPAHAGELLNRRFRAKEKDDFYGRGNCGYDGWGPA